MQERGAGVGVGAEPAPLARRTPLQLAQERRVADDRVEPRAVPGRQPVGDPDPVLDLLGRHGRGPRPAAAAGRSGPPRGRGPSRARRVRRRAGGPPRPGSGPCRRPDRAPVTLGGRACRDPERPVEDPVDQVRRGVERPAGASLVGQLADQPVLVGGRERLGPLALVHVRRLRSACYSHNDYKERRRDRPHRPADRPLRAHHARLLGTGRLGRATAPCSRCSRDGCPRGGGTACSPGSAACSP